MRALLVLVLLALPPAVAAQEGAALEEGDAAGADPAALQQQELYEDGLVVMGVTFAVIVLGAAGMWWVNHRYHPPGEAQRAKSRRD